MKPFFVITAIMFLISCNSSKRNSEKTWISLFDGTTLNGWKVSEHAGTFTVQNGNIVVYGDRSHLFYDGPVLNHDFKDFEFEAEVMTTPGSNSGIFFSYPFSGCRVAAKRL